LIPDNIIVNADDFGLNASVNDAILTCFKKGFINSASLMANKLGFREAINLIHANKCIQNIGVHINLVDGAPVSYFQDGRFLDQNGCWNMSATGKKIQIFNKFTTSCFREEIKSQVEKVKNEGIEITHIDSHLHLHTLPHFTNIFIDIAKEYSIKLRLAQTYNEGYFLKFLFRYYLNSRIKRAGLNYSDLFETISYFKKNDRHNRRQIIEVMLHPDFNTNGELTDHYIPTDVSDWLAYLNSIEQ
jgi:predicted glycoside hydrolase/deacetylase ChbG (UPF0249 family)